MTPPRVSTTGTNINYLLEQFGVAVRGDALIRTGGHAEANAMGLLHPKEVRVVYACRLSPHTRACRSASLCCLGLPVPATPDDHHDPHQVPLAAATAATATSTTGSDILSGLRLVYPYGATLALAADAATQGTRVRTMDRHTQDCALSDPEPPVSSRIHGL